MIIHCDSQAMTALGAPAFQNLAAIGASHALSKTMDPDTAANFRLISAFYHTTFL